MNQTEMLLAHARDDVDRRLIEYGFNPWQVDRFVALSASERLRQTSALARWVYSTKARNAARLK